MLEPLTDTEWRVFRLLIRDLPERELEAVEQQLQREMTHRQESDTSWARLFFTSLSSVDLQRAAPRSAMNVASVWSCFEL
jgi:hypothetical protein